MIFFLLFLFFLIDWIVFLAVLHVVGGGVNLLLALAILFLIIHFVRRRRAV